MAPKKSASGDKPRRAPAASKGAPKAAPAHKKSAPKAPASASHPRKPRAPKAPVHHDDASSTISSSSAAPRKPVPDGVDKSFWKKANEALKELFEKKMAAKKVESDKKVTTKALSLTQDQCEVLSKAFVEALVEEIMKRGHEGAQKAKKVTFSRHFSFNLAYQKAQENKPPNQEGTVRTAPRYTIRFSLQPGMKEKLEAAFRHDIASGAAPAWVSSSYSRDSLAHQM